MGMRFDMLWLTLDPNMMQWSFYSVHHVYIVLGNRNRKYTELLIVHNWTYFSYKFNSPWFAEIFTINILFHLGCISSGPLIVWCRAIWQCVKCLHFAGWRAMLSRNHLRFEDMKCSTDTCFKLITMKVSPCCKSDPSIPLFTECNLCLTLTWLTVKELTSSIHILLLSRSHVLPWFNYSHSITKLSSYWTVTSYYTGLDQKCYLT